MHKDHITAGLVFGVIILLLTIAMGVGTLQAWWWLLSGHPEAHLPSAVFYTFFFLTMVGFDVVIYIKFFHNKFF